MELYSAEVAKVNALVKDWWENNDTELEATFGFKGQVDVQTFLNVATRLRSKGMEGLPQQEKLNICLPDHFRFSMVGMGVIQQYCRDNILAGKPFDALIKERSANSESNLDISDYDLRIKSRRELPLAQDSARVKDVLSRWPNQRKAFRLIRRWTYLGKGVRYDLSMVRSTPRDKNGEFKWQRNFRDRSLLTSPPIYEIEVELERSAFNDVEQAYKGLLSGIREVLQGIQKSPLLIRKNRMADILGYYEKLTGTTKFRGVAPVPLQLENMISDTEEKVPNIRKDYNVTDKADGLRVHALCNDQGELFLIDMSMTVYRTGLKNTACSNSLLDGEWVTRDNDAAGIQQLLLFDIYIDKDQQNVTKLPFKGGRYAKMQTWVQTWNTSVTKAPGAQLLVACKTFLFGVNNPKDLSIFINSGRILDTARIYPTDGLIFTPNSMALPQKAGETFYEQFKWKPAEDNTVDFYVVFEKENNEDRVMTDYNRGKYKILRLFVGSSRDVASENPRGIILNNQVIPDAEPSGKYRPVLFNPTDYPDTMANQCYRLIETDPETQEEYVLTERSQEPIRDQSIVECRYDSTQPPGWKWIPIRVRVDKIERLQKAMQKVKVQGYEKRGESVYNKTLNSEKVANDVWNSIYQPVTDLMIRTGAEEPGENEIRAMIEGADAITKKYFDRKAPSRDTKKVEGLRDFHKQWIKETLLYGSFFKGPPGKTLIDVAVGEANDLQRWRRGNAGFVLGIDAAGENILNSESGAYARYLSTIQRHGKENVPTCVFVIGESQRYLIDGEAGATPEERDILRSIFGQLKPEGVIPSFIDQFAAGRLRNKADGISCQFALHYFFKSKEMFDGLLKNIRDTLKIGGLFFGAAFDGEKVFDLLRGLPNGGKRIGTDATSELWSITKMYDADEIPVGDEGFGFAIDVKFITIGSNHIEYLIPFNLLVEKLKTIGLEILSVEDIKALSLQASSQMFDDSYQLARKHGKKYFMSDATKQFSFLNRWFIFKRTSEGTGVDLMPTAEEEALSSIRSEIQSTAVEMGELVTEKKGVEAPVAKGTAVKPAEEVLSDANIKEIVIDRTIPVAATAVPIVPGTLALKTFSANEIFQFYADAALQDKLKIGDKGAGRWLSPNAPFRIPDPSDPTELYPSVEHYIAGQKLKRASNKPELGPNLFTNTGTVHQSFERQRLELTDGGTKALSEDVDFDLLKKESEKVRDELKPASLRKYGVVIDDGKYETLKNGIIREALQYRLEKDVRFRKIIEAARSQGKVLLYYTGTVAGSELGGVRRANGQIDGQNKIGKFIMELAGGFPSV
jgi:hypothetical protein